MIFHSLTGISVPVGAYYVGDIEDMVVGDRKATPEEVAQYEADRSAEQTITAWKKNRQELVDAIEVTHNGIIYQGDEKSQERINRAITGISVMPVGSTINWTAKDNTVHALVRDDFIAILIDAGQQQSAIWNMGRP